MVRFILVTGATGRLGGAVIRHLLASPAARNEFKIFALTDDPSSPAAQLLAQQDVTLIKGDFESLCAVFNHQEFSKQGIWGIFSTQVPISAAVMISF
jgi:nucleoside-diphosphate-sugar epimerase